jgi:transcriptional regulator with XRE-family HTH domain
VTDKPAPKDPIIAALIRARRDQKLTLLDLGRRMGRSTPQTVWQWENVTRGPSLVNVHQWAEALGFDLILRKRSQ